jgi:hypothetical protein
LSETAQHVVKGATFLDPAVVINFHVENLTAGLNHVNNLNIQEQPILPHWMPPATAYPIGAEMFKQFIMCCCAEVTNGGIVDSFIIAPNTTSEFARVAIRIGMLCRDEFILAVAGAADGHLGRVFMVKESARSVVAEAIVIDHFGLPVGATPAFL